MNVNLVMVDGSGLTLTVVAGSNSADHVIAREPVASWEISTRRSWPSVGEVTPLEIAVVGEVRDCWDMLANPVGVGVGETGEAEDRDSN